MHWRIDIVKLPPEKVDPMSDEEFDFGDNKVVAVPGFVEAWGDNDYQLPTVSNVDEVPSILINHIKSNMVLSVNPLWSHQKQG